MILPEAFGALNTLYYHLEDEQSLEVGVCVCNRISCVGVGGKSSCNFHLCLYALTPYYGIPKWTHTTTTIASILLSGEINLRKIISLFKLYILEGSV